MKPSSQPYDEVALLSLLKAGHSKAFQELYDRFASTLRWRLIRLVNDQDLADDLLQDSFLKICSHVPEFDSSKGHLYAWMTRIVEHTAFDYLERSKTIRRTLQADFWEEEQIVHPSYDLMDLRTWMSAVLNAYQHQLINLAYLQGYTHQEIALKLALPLGTVKTHIRGALMRLRDTATLV